MDEFETLTPAKKKEGIVFVISGPSGSGKGTVIGHLKEMYPNLGLAVSATTRDMRPGERDGVEYFFKTREFASIQFAVIFFTGRQQRLIVFEFHDSDNWCYIIFLLHIKYR